MTDQEIVFGLCSIFYDMARPRSKQTCSQWVEENICFNEPGRVGRFSFRGREYLREPLDFYSNDLLTDMVMTFGTRTGKTTIMYAGTAYRIIQKARRVLYVKPTTNGTAGAKGDAKTRFMPMLRASEVLKRQIPSGALRHNFTTPQQMLLNGSIVDWVGSNSVAQLASNSVEDVNQDEIDKFNTTRKRDSDGNEVEADAVDLADERTGEFRIPKRVKASTPTLTTGRIWTELLKTDLRRRYVPCPLCGLHHPSSKLVVLAWSKDFTTLPKENIPLAYVEWDKEARKEKGNWDYERVEKSAGYLCPHCCQRFQDDKKIWMDANGEWKPTQAGAQRTRGYHLPSMYSNHDQTTAGKLALDFLEGKKSLEGPRNFINSKLAEAYSMQGISIDKAGQVGKQIEVTGEWLKILTADYHQNQPYFWAVVRAWNGTDQTHGVEYLAFNDWGMMDELQEKHKIIPQAVGIDIGFDMPTVLKACSNIDIPTRCVLAERIMDALPECNGWSPMQSYGGKRLYKDEEAGLLLPYHLKKDVDPWAGSELAHTMRIEVLQWANDVFEDMLENIRFGKTGLKWTISKEMDTDEYHKHMNGTKRVFDSKQFRTYKWTGKARLWPDHIRACERMSLVLAYRLQLISFDAMQTLEKKQVENKI